MRALLTAAGASLLLHVGLIALLLVWGAMQPPKAAVERSAPSPKPLAWLTLDEDGWGVGPGDGSSETAAGDVADTFPRGASSTVPRDVTNTVPRESGGLEAPSTTPKPVAPPLPSPREPAEAPSQEPAAPAPRDAPNTVPHDVTDTVPRESGGPEAPPSQDPESPPDVSRAIEAAGSAIHQASSEVGEGSSDAPGAAVDGPPAGGTGSGKPGNRGFSDGLASGGPPGRGGLGGGASGSRRGRGGSPYGPLLRHLQARTVGCYPRSAERRGVEGTTELSFCVGDAGQVSSILVRKSSGSRVLDEAATDCVLRGAAPLPAPPGCISSLPIRFHLR